MRNYVKEYYDNNYEKEWDRLKKPYRIIEFMSTMYLIEKYFPKEGNAIDIGCGPGRYSIELLKKGYNVTLFELSGEELKLAKSKIEEEGLKAQEYICEDALNLHFLESEKYDVLLLMGPMYHVLNETDRVKILKEARRILKDDGIALISYINSWGCLKSGVTEFSEVFSDLQNVYNYLDEQKFDPNSSFTNLYMTTPTNALKEVTEAGFNIISYAGVESFLSGIESRVVELAVEDKNVYNNLLKVASETCEYPQYRDATEHIHIIVKK